jgi:uncharacterized membrane protein
MPAAVVRITWVLRELRATVEKLCSATEQEFQGFIAAEVTRAERLAWHVACFTELPPSHDRSSMASPARLHDLSTSSTVTGAPQELERWAGVAMATAVVAYGLSRRSLPGVALAAAAAPLAYRGVTGEWPGFMSMGDTRAALSGNRGIHVREAMSLEVPLETVYDFWRHLENLPRVMTHLKEVRDLGGGRSHWVVEGPAGTTAEWDADIINEVPNKVIGWRSIPGSEVATAGSVHFSTARQGRTTRVSVNLQYAAPGGRASRLLAFVLGRDPATIARGAP